MNKIELRVYCSECGSILEVASPEVFGTNFTFIVKPCEVCKKEKENNNETHIG